MVRAGTAAMVICAGWLALERPTSASAVEASYAAVGQETSVPYGWVDFCRRYEGECNDERCFPCCQWYYGRRPAEHRCSCRIERTHHEC